MAQGGVCVAWSAVIMTGAFIWRGTHNGAGWLVCGFFPVYKHTHDDLGTYTNYVPGALILALPGKGADLPCAAQFPTFDI
jgi:hypothetical protein